MQKSRSDQNITSVITAADEKSGAVCFVCGAVLRLIL